MQKRLYRNEENRVFAGVIGGLGEYFDVDPVILRVIWVAITVFTGVAPGIVIYVLAIVVMPARAGVVIHEHDKETHRKADASPKTSS